MSRQRCQPRARLQLQSPAGQGRCSMTKGKLFAGMRAFSPCTHITTALLQAHAWYRPWARDTQGQPSQPTSPRSPSRRGSLLAPMGRPTGESPTLLAGRCGRAAGEREWRSMGARTASEAASIITAQMLRSLSVRVHSGHMRVLYARLRYVGMSAAQAATHAGGGVVVRLVAE